MTNEINIPTFSKEIRDEILNWTDDKSHRSMIKCADSPFETVILAGGKGWGKSFMFPCLAVWNILNNPNYYCIMARNQKIDIKNTLKACLEEFLFFLNEKYGINLIKHFEINSEEAIFKPTKQKIFFESFNKQSAFAGFNVGNYNGFIGDVFLDEIMQKRSTFSNLSDSEIDDFYKKQEEDFKTIKKGTILRKAPKPGERTRHLYISFNIWERDHWIIKKYFDSMMPLGTPESHEELETKHYIYKESKELDCCIMRASKLYVPRESMSDAQLKDIEDDKINNYNLYLVTVLGEAYLESDLENINPFHNLIYEKKGCIREELFFDPAKFSIEDFKLIVDGWDPGVVDKNGLCRIGVTNDDNIFVLWTEEINVDNIKTFKRTSAVKKILNRVQSLNNALGVENSILAIDSKDDAVAELALSTIIKEKMPINIVKAIKNKNSTFKIDFSISSRMQIIKNFIQLGILKFAPATSKLLEYLSLIVLDKKNDSKRDEKINPEIYDLVNAFEYALSVIYKNIIIANTQKGVLDIKHA